MTVKIRARDKKVKQVKCVVYLKNSTQGDGNREKEIKKGLLWYRSDLVVWSRYWEI